MADFTGASDGGDVATDSIWAAAGDIAYATSDDTATVLSVGDNKDILQLACGVPSWASDLAFCGDLTVGGGCITLGTSKILSGGNTTSLNLIDAIDATTETTFECAIDALSNLVEVGALDAGSITSNFGTINNGTSAITTSGLITGGTFSTGNSGTAKFLDGNGSHYFTLAAHATTTASVAYTWPAASGCACQVLTCNGSGVLSWAAAGGGGTTINNATANELVTIGASTDELCAEAGLTYNADTVEFTMSGTGQQDMIVRNTGTGDAIITSSVDGGSANAIVFFKEATTTKYGLIYNTNANRLAIRSGSLTSPNDGDVIRIPDGAHNVEITNGNIVMGTAGKGIDFSAATPSEGDAGSCVTSSILDNYEEGTWTPERWDNSKSDCENQTYHNRQGVYTLIGNHVFLNMSWNPNAKGCLTDAEQMTIGGIPFTPGGPTNIRFAGSIGYPASINITSTGGPMIIARIDDGADKIHLHKLINGTNQSILTNADFGTDSVIDVTIDYTID